MIKTPARATVELYSSTARTLHWTTVALLAVQFPVGLYMVYRGKSLNLWDGLTNVLYGGHKLVGVTLTTYDDTLFIDEFPAPAATA